MKNSLLFLIGIVASSCGLVSKYQSGQHAVYAKMLTQVEKEQINHSGEITKEIALGNPVHNRLLKGTLRIMKTENPNVFNFVEIGQWVEHGKLASSGRLHKPEFKDTTVNDNLGNSITKGYISQN